MPDSLRRLTVAACSEDEHRAVDLALPADMHIAMLLPQIVDLVLQRDVAMPPTGADWRLSRLGEPAMDESMTLNDNDIRDGDVLLLTTIEPLGAEWNDCDPCRAMATHARVGPSPLQRFLAVLCCVLLGGFGSVALAWPAADISPTAKLTTGAGVAVAAAVGAAVVRRLSVDPLIAVALSLLAVLYAAAVGVLIAGPDSPASGLVLGASTAFSAAILLLRVTRSGRTCLTVIATVSALVAAVAAVGVMWSPPLNTVGAALATISLATLGFAPRLSMVLSGTGVETVAPDSASCHDTLTGLVLGSSIATALGAALVTVGEIGIADIAFSAVVAIVLLLRARTHVDDARRIGLVATGMCTASAAFAAVVVSAPGQAHLMSALAATTGTAALCCISGLTISPVLRRSVEIVEYLALAAVVPLACWVGGIYGLARGMTLI